MKGEEVSFISVVTIQSERAECGRSIMNYISFTHQTSHDKYIISIESVMEANLSGRSFLSFQCPDL